MPVVDPALTALADVLPEVGAIAITPRRGEDGATWGVLGFVMLDRLGELLVATRVDEIDGLLAFAAEQGTAEQRSLHSRLRLAVALMERLDLARLELMPDGSLLVELDGSRPGRS